MDYGCIFAVFRADPLSGAHIPPAVTVGPATTGTYAGSTGPVSLTALVSELLRTMMLVFAVLDLTGPQLDLSGRFVPGEGSFPPGPVRRLGLCRRSARRPGWADDWVGAGRRHRLRDQHSPRPQSATGPPTPAHSRKAGFQPGQRTNSRCCPFLGDMRAALLSMIVGAA